MLGASIRRTRVSYRRLLVVAAGVVVFLATWLGAVTSTGGSTSFCAAPAGLLEVPVSQGVHPTYSELHGQDACEETP